jgi:hypothetical protein
MPPRAAIKRPSEEDEWQRRLRQAQTNDNGAASLASRWRSAMRGWQMAVIEIAIIVRSSASLERTRGAPERRHAKGKYYNLRITRPIPFDIGFLPTYN